LKNPRDEERKILKTLYILRHAKAAPESGDGDAERPLVKRGRKAAALMGEYLAAQKPLPDLVLCSTASRTRETLEEVLPSLKPSPSILFEEKLYLASLSRLTERLQQLPESITSVLLIGHNPGLHQLAATLVDDARPLDDGFPTAALAVLKFEGSWAGLGPNEATLGDYRTPKALSRDPAFDGD
jgi:phosphohistidine phosphatase